MFFFSFNSIITKYNLNILLFYDLIDFVYCKRLNPQYPSKMREERVNIDGPLWDLNTFVGRWKHFAWMTDFRTCVTPESKLLEAKKLCEDYK